MEAIARMHETVETVIAVAADTSGAVVAFHLDSYMTYVVLAVIGLHVAVTITGKVYAWRKLRACRAERDYRLMVAESHRDMWLRFGGIR